MSGGQTFIEISISDQTLSIYKNDSELRRFFVSTSKFGEGFESGSYKTPLGRFVISEKIGDKEAPGTVFKGRKPVGNWKLTPELFDANADLILTRILWLDGVEVENSNTKSRYIYIHGTNQESLIGKQGSWGCIRMNEQDLLWVYEYCEVGTSVEIHLSLPERLKS